MQLSLLSVWLRLSGSLSRSGFVSRRSWFCVATVTVIAIWWMVPGRWRFVSVLVTIVDLLVMRRRVRLMVVVAPIRTILLMLGRII
jgi:hypothetical protein